MLPMEHSTDAQGGFLNWSLQNSVLFHYLMKKIVFNSNVPQTFSTTSQKCLIHSLSLQCGQIP